MSYRHRVPGYEHALYMRAVSRALLRGEAPPPVDVPLADLEAQEAPQIERWGAPKLRKHAAAWAAAEAWRADLRRDAERGAHE